MMNWFKYYYQRIFHFNNFSRNLTPKNKDDKMPQNIYGMEDLSYKEFVSYQNRIHQVFKYLFLVPALCFLKWILGKSYVSKIPDKTYYTNFKVLDKAFEDSLFIWCNEFRLNGPLTKRLPPYERKIALDNMFKDNTSTNHLRTMKNLMITMCKNDTAYLEFFNILMFTLTLNMNNTYNKHPKHMFFTNPSITDVSYFVLHPKLHESNLRKDDKSNKAKSKVK